MSDRKITVAADLSPRPQFSRFERNIAAKKALPIFPLALPKAGKAGVLIVGDYIVNDLFGFMKGRSYSSRNWIVVSMVQSDAIPTDCVQTDLNLFANQLVVPEYLASPAGKVPFAPLVDGHFVDSNLLFPDRSAAKSWDILYPAKWYPTKQTELLVQAAALDPSIKVAIYGWPVVSERKSDASRQYRDEIVSLASDLPNVEIFDSGFDNDNYHRTDDRAEIVGRFTREQMRDRFFRRSLSSINLSATTEAVNRACAEMLCCDVPMMVSPMHGGLEQLVNDQTGVHIERSPEGILEGINKIKDRIGQWEPRAGYLANFGREKSNKRLRSLIAQSAKMRSLAVNWEDLTDYGGDPWTPFEVYSRALEC